MLHPNQPPSDEDDPTAEEAAYLARVRALAPAIAAAGEQIESERRIPGPLLDEMVEAGLFRLLLPRSFGGAEAHPLTFMAVLEAIAAVDASPAWNVCQNAVCAISAAYLSPQAAHRIFGEQGAILAWGPPGPGTKAMAVEGGYRVTGNWSFASGGRHATWLGAYCPVYEADGTPRRSQDGATVRRVMLLPAGEATMSDVWHVIGLRGTASDSFTIEDAYVPHEFSFVRDDRSELREQGWLYSFSHVSLYACGFASIALGVARAMLDAFIALAAEKTPRGAEGALRENSATQSDLALAEARLRAARAFLMQSITEICAVVRQTKQITLEQRMTIRLAATHAIREAMQVGDFAYEAAGSNAIFAGGPFERRFRDLHAIGQQVQGRKSHYQTVGKYLMGLEPDSIFF